MNCQARRYEGMYSINDRGSTRGAAVSPNPLKPVNDSGVTKRLRKMLTRKLFRFGRILFFSGESRFGIEARGCARGACCFARTRFAANDPVAPRDGTVFGRHLHDRGQGSAHAVDDQCRDDPDIHHCAQRRSSRAWRRSDSIIDIMRTAVH